jgi:arylsulfatase A-like enzyme
VRGGTVSNAPTELIDLAATMLDFAGLAVPESWDGRSLRGVLSGKQSRHREWSHCAYKDWQVATDGQWKLLTQTGQPDRLFDLHTDPRELANAAGESPAVLSRLRRALNEATAVR